GALVYAFVGVNRIRRGSKISARPPFGQAMQADPRFEAAGELVAARFGKRSAALKAVGDRVTHHRLTTGNSIESLTTGDEAYAAMGEAIDKARRSLILETYIFDRDPIGLRIACALSDAIRRGVSERVLIDAVGARYS